jgi:hypothetical protein
MYNSKNYPVVFIVIFFRLNALLRLSGCSNLLLHFRKRLWLDNSWVFGFHLLLSRGLWFESSLSISRAGVRDAEVSGGAIPKRGGVTIARGMISHIEF